jgi:hypothetical protein
MYSRLRFHGAVDVGRSTALIFVIRPPEFTRPHGSCRPHIVVQRDGLLIEANHRFCRIMRPFVYFQHVFHLRQILVSEICDAPHFFPATA